MSDNQATLAERLGYEASQKLVIISCDDLGSCHSANVGVYSAIRDGVASCASVMVPAPWARHAAEMYNGEDIGVHITLNAEHPYIAGVPLLMPHRCCPVTVVSHAMLMTSGSTPTQQKYCVNVEHKLSVPSYGDLMFLISHRISA